MGAFFVETLRGPTNSTVHRLKPLPPGANLVSLKALGGGLDGRQRCDASGKLKTQCRPRLLSSTLHSYATLTRCLLAALHQEWVLGRSFAQNRGAQRSPSEGDRLSLSKNAWINASGARGKRKVPYSLI
jgi:hypothetical protein